jgi:hypothetical protein
MPNRTEARSEKASVYEATGRLPPLRLFSTPLIDLFQVVLFRNDFIFWYVLLVTVPPCRNIRIGFLCSPVPFAISRSENLANCRRVSGSATTRPFSYTLHL